MYCTATTTTNNDEYYHCHPWEIEIMLETWIFNWLKHGYLERFKAFFPAHSSFILQMLEVTVANDEYSLHIKHEICCQTLAF